MYLKGKNPDDYLNSTTRGDPPVVTKDGKAVWLILLSSDHLTSSNMGFHIWGIKPSKIQLATEMLPLLFYEGKETDDMFNQHITPAYQVIKKVSDDGGILLPDCSEKIPFEVGNCADMKEHVRNYENYYFI
jgi:hypothetical protein